MRVILDTNVLVSGLLELFSYPARVIDLVYIGRLQCVYDDRIMREYEEVLARPKLMTAISEKERNDLLGYLMHSGRKVLAGPLEEGMLRAPDPDDLPFVEVAAAGQAELIITGNSSHFSFFADNSQGINIVSPRACYDLICDQFSGPWTLMKHENSLKYSTRPLRSSLVSYPETSCGPAQDAKEDFFPAGEPGEKSNPISLDLIPSPHTPVESTSRPGPGPCPPGPAAWPCPGAGPLRR